MPCRRLLRLGHTDELIVALDMNDISGLALLAGRLLQPIRCGGGQGRRACLTQPSAWHLSRTMAW
jgi:hypothetical protein